MAKFPRTKIGNLSVSRMIIGTNWFLGYSHTSQAKDKLIYKQTPKTIADILVVYLKHGIDTLLGTFDSAKLMKAIKIAQDRSGKKIIVIATPGLRIENTPEAYSANARMLDKELRQGARICMPHEGSTDAMLDKTTRRIRGAERLLAMIRERGMLPGFSTHMPETPIYADETGLDVETYIQIYNAAGFLMQVEVDWVNRIIQKSKKPVLTIKPMASGRLLPLVGLAFSWSTIRDKDMVAVGTMTPDEAKEVIDISWSILKRQASTVKLQQTRSKKSVLRKK